MFTNGSQKLQSFKANIIFFPFLVISHEDSISRRGNPKGHTLLTQMAVYNLKG